MTPRPSPHHASFYSASAFGAAAFLARLLPLRVTRAIAAVGGLYYAFTHPAKVRVVRGNLRLLNPSLGMKKARQVYAEFGRTLADYFYIGTRSAADAAKIISRITGQEHLHAAHRAGHGALIVTAHLGLFELGGLLMAQSGFPSAALTFPEPSQPLTDWRTAFRRRWNVDTIEIGADNFAFLQIAQRLRQGCFVATLIDRPHPRESIPVQLPNGIAHFSTAILLLAAQCGTPVIPATMVRQSDGSYHAQVFEPLFIKEKGSRTETLELYSQRIADILLPVLRAHPEQWYQFVPLNPILTEIPEIL
jgi:KDO2-lipid IV(A) lauroyltransferase